MAKARESKEILVESSQILESKIGLIEEIRSEILSKVSDYLHKLRVNYSNLSHFLKNPHLYNYPGNRDNVKQIVKVFLNKAISKRYFAIKKENLTIRYVCNFILHNLCRGSNLKC